MPPLGISAGVLSALSFGAGDFAGAFAARRAGALVVVAGAHVIGLVALLMGVAGVAAVGFGTWYVLLDLAARGGDPLWALVFSRTMSAGLALAFAVGRFDRSRFPWRIVIAAGLFDVGGNSFYVIARDGIPIGLAAALSGMYPIVTMILARFILGERLPRLGQAGVALALIGIGLISVGG